MEQTIFSNANPKSEANWTDADYEAECDRLLGQLQAITVDMDERWERIERLQRKSAANLVELKKMTAALSIR